jgi:membrane protease YdiL (CAAX protease family)
MSSYLPVADQKDTAGQRRSAIDASAPALQLAPALPQVGFWARPIELPLFLGVLVVLSGLAWAPVITDGSLDAGGGLFIAFGMWVPAVAALSTRAFCHGTLRGLGWRPGKRRYLACGYILPLMLAAAVYGTAWLTGLARFEPGGIANSLPVQQRLSD